jgi:hypothetical protein
MAIRHEIRTDDGMQIIEDLTARKAIKLFCSECMGFSPKSVRFCEVNDCPLWPFRTHKTPKDTV